MILKRIWPGSRQKNKTERQKESKNEENKNVSFPIGAEKQIFKTKKGLLDFREPILFLIKENNKVEFFENVKPGILKVKNSDKDADIILDSSKLLSFEYKGSFLKGWIAYVKEAIPYPSNVEHDSALLYQQISALMLSLKNYKEQKMEGWGSLILWGAVAIAIIIGASAIFGPGGMFGPPIQAVVAAAAPPPVILNATIFP